MNENPSMLQGHELWETPEEAAQKSIYIDISKALCDWKPWLK